MAIPAASPDGAGSREVNRRKQFAIDPAKRKAPRKRAETDNLARAILDRALLRKRLSEVDTWQNETLTDAAPQWLVRRCIIFVELGPGMFGKQG
jgi:hypothetical protein